MQRKPRVTNDLELKVEGGAARLTPREGLQLAEDLARKSMRRAMVEGAEADTFRPAAPGGRSSAASSNPARRGAKHDGE